MKVGDIVAHGRYPNRVGYVTGVEHASHGPIIAYTVVWMNGAHKGQEHKISTWQAIDMQEALESARNEAANRESALTTWRHTAAMMKIAAK